MFNIININLCNKSFNLVTLKNVSISYSKFIFISKVLSKVTHFQTIHDQLKIFKDI